MKRSHTITELKAIVAWCKTRNRSPAHWATRLRLARRAQRKNKERRIAA